MDSTVQQYLDCGLRGLWYPVLASWEVQANPVGITRLGEQIVVWRDSDGRSLPAPGGSPVAWLEPGRSHRLLVSRC